jgi:chromosome segregation ATPase
MKTNAIDTSVQPESTSIQERSRVDVVSQRPATVSAHPVASLRPAFETELAGFIDRLMAQAVAESDAAVERAQAAGQIALAAAAAALAEQTRRNDGLTESLLQSEIQVEELRVQLKRECEHTKAARDAFEEERSVRARTEAANDEARTVREQIVSAYESRLQAVHAELDAARAEFIGVKQQLEVEGAEQKRLIAALRTVREACAFAEPKADTPVGRVPITLEGRAPENEVTTEPPVQMPDHETLASTTAPADRRLKLVASGAVASVPVPPHFLEYFKELFEQIDAMYQVDRRAHASVDVVERLSANLRYARDVFVQRASSEGLMGATLFEQELSKKLDEVGATSLGRHLAIAAYELTQVGPAHDHAEAS